jgi:predicted amidohydrolase YtcJ
MYYQNFKKGKLHKLLLVIGVGLVLTSCNNMKESADIIVSNAHVYTVNDSFEIAEAFALRDGHFVGVGTQQEIFDRFEASRIIDVGGRSVFPGFIDGHCHFHGYGENLFRWADLNGTKSFDELLDRLEAHLATHPSEWLLGRGWDQNHWKPAVFPDNELLEKRFPGKKILLVRIDGHASLVSKSALQAAGIDATYKVKGGDVLLNAKGEPTGVLIDNADLAVKALIPELTSSEKQKALLEAQENCFAVGLTSVVDAGLPVQTIELIRQMHLEGHLKMKINTMINPDDETLNTYLPAGPSYDERLTINTVKMFADGALGSRGALMLEPYSDAAREKGLMLQDSSFYFDVCQKAYDAGFQVSIHAIGDAANRFVLDMYAEFLKTENDRRWRVEHAQIVHPDDFVKFKTYSIIPSIQSTHATSDMYWAVNRVGEERIKGAYAQQKLLAQNAWLVNGTDFPIEGINPLQTFYAAVVRKDLKGFPEEGFLMDQALSREQAIKSMTIWAAKASFEESYKGSIEIGKHADFVILDRDIMQVAEAEIPQTSVIATFVHGEGVYQHE